MSTRGASIRYVRFHQTHLEVRFQQFIVCEAHISGIWTQTDRSLWLGRYARKAFRVLPSPSFLCQRPTGLARCALVERVSHVRA